MAIITGVESAVKLHIKRGDSLDARDNKSLTPIMLAALNDKAEICKLLLEAGSNPYLLDLNGNDALKLAELKGASRTASVIRNALASQNGSQKINDDTVKIESVEDFSDYETIHFDTNLWEPEEEKPAPLGDLTLIDAAKKIYDQISTHIPVDQSEDWTFFEAFLPEKATEISKDLNNEDKLRLRRVFLEAVMNGSVRESEVDSIVFDGKESYDEELKNLISLVVSDLGANLDSQIEEQPYFEYDEINSADELTLTEAIEFFEDLSSNRNDVFRGYAKDIYRTSLLSADDEIHLSKEMEDGLTGAIDALSSWRGGLSELIEYAKLVEHEIKTLDWLSSPNSSEINIDNENYLQPPPDIDTDEDEVEMNEDQNERDFFFSKIKTLSQHISNDSVIKNSASIKRTLDEISLSREFLIELCSRKDLIIEGGEQSFRFVNCVKRAESARDRMITSNLRLVLSIAKRYQGISLPYEDLIQEGNLGLIKAVDRFDWSKGFKLSTYATWWIRQSITRALSDKGRLIRVPVHLNDLMYRVSKLADDNVRIYGKKASTKELAKTASVSEKRIENMLKILDPISLNDITDITLQANSISFNAEFSDPFNAIAYQELRELFDCTLSNLDIKNGAEIIRLRYGLADGEFRSLEEVGVKFNVTRERIRQVESKVLSKLAHPSRAGELMEYLDFNFSSVNELEPLHLN